MSDLISRQAAIDALVGITMFKTKHELMQRVNASVQDEQGWLGAVAECLDEIEDLPSAQPEQRYTEEELRVFAHGISLSLLSKRSAQHWRYDKDTATEIEFLERLYDKVSADMKGDRGAKERRQP